MTRSTAVDLTQVLPGFAEPVFDAQASFRRILEAMSYVGRTVELTALGQAPAPLHRATAAVALTLMDQQTPVWLDAAASAAPVRDYLRFHCGTPIVEEPQAVRFAIVADPAAMPALSVFAQGDERYPDRSATVILQLEDLTDGPPVVLTGPGIRDRIEIRPCGLPDRFWTEWRENARLYPVGVDVLLTGATRLVALPRTARREG